LAASTAKGVVIDLDRRDKNMVSSIPNNLDKRVTDTNDVIMLAVIPPIMGIKFFINASFFL
jgi:hypothetical protein